MRSVTVLIVKSFAGNKPYISYDKESILEIINYQAENELTNAETAKLFTISTVTLRKWKRYFEQDI